MRSRLVAVGLAVVTAGSSMLASLTAQASDEPELRVEYDPPHVSVAATEVGLGELLRLIGAKVGFSVAEGRAALRLVTVSIAHASLDDVLRQLLRAENHTILYRQGADAVVMVDRIVLLGPPPKGCRWRTPGRGRVKRPPLSRPVRVRALRRGRECDDGRAAGLRGRHAPVASARRPSPAARGRRGAGAGGPRDRAVTIPGSDAREPLLHGLRPGTSATGARAREGPGGVRRWTPRLFCIPRPCVVPFGEISRKRPNCSNEPVPDGAVCEALGAWRLGGDPPGG
jgi:hypothetical protein